MSAIVLDDIRFKADLDELCKRLHIDPESEYAEQAAELARKAEGIARPKALYREAFVDRRDEENVYIDGVRIHSRIMSINFKGIHRVFPYITTCGRELHTWVEALDDILEQYWAGAIMEMALGAAYDALLAHLDSEYHTGRLSAMNPGSLADWPLKGQRDLFSLLGGSEGTIGVELTESFLMIPMKTTSGILFQAEEGFHSCSLCDRKACPNRRAPYDEELYSKKYDIRENID
ncbi:MAG TPA: vitamin B12 dependent-methionine synthase activation domain-containing protein, partial [Candidatus Atribacteria bacterium]|nr:vitamin B12 dependent-methionine synthase activation domain-containing protein [Candidatus Atribacteria bacterium]